MLELQNDRTDLFDLFNRLTEEWVHLHFLWYPRVGHGARRTGASEHDVAQEVHRLLLENNKKEELEEPPAYHAEQRH